ncbi:hypothetical protein AWENTII_006454 [Aspergillus wentii]
MGGGTVKKKFHSSPGWVAGTGLGYRTFGGDFGRLYRLYNSIIRFGGGKDGGRWEEVLALAGGREWAWVIGHLEEVLIYEFDFNPALAGGRDGPGFLSNIDRGRVLVGNND